ncbi:MAG: alpha-glucosidase [Erysipelotrichales bacterium]|nr:alpha-glucosidase [Erysipelotrichales bacterium]
MKENKVTLDSKIKDLYRTPIGHDTIGKVLLQLGISDFAITNPVVGNLKLRTLANLTKSKLGSGFFDTLLHLINSEKDVPADGKGEITETWWKEAVFYQIYPRSFCDTNGDGIGDLRGIIEKLDYLKDLGITCLWLSPIYDSPNDDNGYDIRDYHKIMTEFGTMEDFDELLAGIHARGMRLIMDLVVNHTSDEHEWFKKALEDPTSKYHDYYMFRKDDGTHTVPNNWTSFFSGPAWNYYEQNDEWALHLFSKKQMDLNWDNPEVREEVIKMVNWWLDKGVDGFRMDVINYISKEEGLPMGDETIGSMMGYPGIEHYYYGPNLHKYLHEVHEKAFAPHKAFSVGETPGIGMEMAKLITGEERQELDMVFSFDQLETPGHVRWDDYEYDLDYYKKYITDWMLHYGNNCWMSLFYNNHDNPRMVSKISMDPKYTEAIEKLLAIMQLTLKGTPFIFQGDEMGLVNYPFKSVDEVTDVEAKGYVAELRAKGISEEEILKTILAGTREHTRILLPWNTYPSDFREEMRQPIRYNITEMYRKLIALRKSDKTLVYGDFKVLNDTKGRFVYSRTLNGKEYIVDCNLTKETKKAYDTTNYKLVYPESIDHSDVLSAYEARIWVNK